MTTGRTTVWTSLIAMATFFAMVGSSATVAEAQEFVSPTRGGVKVRPRIVVTNFEPQPFATRGGLKVQSRVFNPFDVSQTRLTLDPFGFFTVAPTPTTTTTTPAASSPSVATTGSTTSSAVSAPSEPATVVSGGTSEQPSLALVDGGGAGSAVRPPFRPPVRSPFRPPPRPPFIP